MGVRNSVFASKSERTNFEHLARIWSSQYRLYPNLPFLHVFDVSNLIDFSSFYSADPSSWKAKEIRLDAADMARLKKTSIDYTLCDSADRPLVCVEFDGLQDGFNVGDTYHTKLPSDPWREIIMSLKLKVAHGSMFPYVVVGSPHFAQVSSDTQLAIVDGIIGAVLANRAVSERIAQGFTPEDVGVSQIEFDGLDQAQQHDMIQDWVFGVEAESDLTYNPIYRACADLQRELGVSGLTVQWLSYPDANKARNSLERREIVEKAILSGSRVTIEHPKAGPFSATVMLPNFKTAGISPIALSQEIAHLVALDRLKAKLSRI